MHAAAIAGEAVGEGEAFERGVGLRGVESEEGTAVSTTGVDAGDVGAVEAFDGDWFVGGDDGGVGAGLHPDGFVFAGNVNAGLKGLFRGCPCVAVATVVGAGGVHVDRAHFKYGGEYGVGLDVVEGDCRGQRARHTVGLPAEEGAFHRLGCERGGLSGIDDCDGWRDESAADNAGGNGQSADFVLVDAHCGFDAEALGGFAEAGGTGTQAVVVDGGVNELGVLGNVAGSLKGGVGRASVGGPGVIAVVAQRGGVVPDDAVVEHAGAGAAGVGGSSVGAERTAVERAVVGGASEVGSILEVEAGVQHAVVRTAALLGDILAEDAVVQRAAVGSAAVLRGAGRQREADQHGVGMGG